MKRELVALLLLSFGCLVIVNILWLFLTVKWFGLQLVIVVFPDHTHLNFAYNRKHLNKENQRLFYENVLLFLKYIK